MCFLFASKMTKFKSCLLGDTITVYVGPQSKRYKVHEALLSRYDWFRKRILRPSNVASYCSIALRAEDPKVFELLISWLYRKKLKAISTTDEKISKEEAALYVDLYFRALVWDIVELQNEIMDRLRARQAHSNVLSTHSMTKIHSSMRSSAQSSLLLYLDHKIIYLFTKLDNDRSRLDPIDATPAMILKPELHSLMVDGDRALMEDYLKVFFRSFKKPDLSDPDKKTGCVYHKHKEGEECRL